MTRTQINLVAVGGFVVAMLVTLIVVLALLAGRTGPRDAYHAIFPNVAGLKFGAPVQYEGYPIGQVEALVPEPRDGRMQFRVELSVIAGWQIPRDSTASIAVHGLLAPPSIEIHAGSEEQALQPGDRIASGSADGLFAGLSGVTEEVGRLSQEGLIPVLRNLDAQLSRVGALLDGDVGATVGHLRSIGAELDAAAPVIVADMRAFSGHLARSGAQLESVLSGDRLARLDRLLDEAATSAAGLGQAARRIDALVADSGDDLGVASQELRQSLETLAGRLDTITHNLDAATRDLAEFSRQVRQDPSRVLRPTRDQPEPRP